MKFIFVLILICLFGCEEKKEIADFSLKNDLEFELLNDEINFIQVNPEQLKSEIVVYSDEQREKALNRIDFKITNVSDKKYVIFLDYKKIESFAGIYKNEFENKLDLNLGDLNVLLNIDYDMTQNKIGTSNFKDDCNEKNLKILSNEFSDKYINYGESLFNENLITLQPNESRIFRSVVYLPILNDSNNSLIGDYSFIFLDSKKEYDFRLGFKQDKKMILDFLNKDQLKELNKNGYEVFHGILISNSVKLKCKN